MDLEAGTMATMTMESWGEYVHSVKPEDDIYLNMSSEDLYRCIDADSSAYPHHIGFDSVSDVDVLGLFKPKVDVEEPKEYQIYDENQYGIYNDDVDLVPNDPPLSSIASFKASYDFFNLPDSLKTLINPRTFQPSSYLSLRVPEKEIKPYHPIQDHDYMKIESEDSDAVEMKEEINEGEPVVDVWKIENFMDEQVSTPHPVPEQLPKYTQILRETRRTSKRTADIKRREQAQKISHAVHAVLNIKKPVIGRQYKNKLKDSVETTPSQSDIEEWQSHSVRPMYTRITKKKTSKGRIDHSQSERNRREILRKKFCELRKKIPLDFLTGEKATAQISKQKILNGAKGYIAEIYNSKSSYGSMQRQNKLFQELWQKKRSSRQQKSVKRLK